MFLLCILIVILSITICFLFAYIKKIKKEITKKEIGSEKLCEFYWVLLQWINVHQEGRLLSDYFIKKNYKSIAIYGMKELGQSLLKELKKSEVEVKYGIDQNLEVITADIDLYSPIEDLPCVDVIVVTAIHYYDEIEKILKMKIKCPIVSIEDVVWEA
jgi:hypothetical protein